MAIIRAILGLLGVMFADRGELVVEILALRQQLAVEQQSTRRLELGKADKIFWVWLSRLWSNWRSAVVVQPATVLRWHRQGFKLYWRWRSKRRTPGRPKTAAEIRELTRRMCRENPRPGSPRIL